MLGGSPVTQPKPCKVVVHAIKGCNLRKQDTQTTDPYLVIQLSEEPGSVKRTRSINKDLNPIWNQKFDFHSKDWNTDRLVVNMYNEMASGEKMMNEINIPINQWPIGTHIDYQEDVVNQKKKNAGRLYLGIDVLNEEPVKQKHVAPAPVPAHVPTPVSTPEPTETETETEPISESTMTETETETEPSVQSRGIHLDDPSCEYCNFSLGDYDSRYSTDFTGFTENSRSLSALHSTEERFHHHHKIDRGAVAEPLQPIVPEQESSHDDHACELSHDHCCESSCQHCNFKWDDLDSRYSTDFVGFTENSRSLSPMHSSEEHFHHNHKQRAAETASILAPETISSEKVENQPAEQRPLQDHDHCCESSCQHCNFMWDNLDSRYSTDFAGFTENSRSLSPMHSSEEHYHHNHKPKPTANTNSILMPENQSGGINNESPAAQNVEVQPRQAPVHNHSHAHDGSCQNCNFSWGDYNSQYSTDFAGFTDNPVSLSALHSTEENLHHSHIPKEEVN